MNLLVTGGAGYIGSHFILEALRNNHQIVAVDNFLNSYKETIDKIESIAEKKIHFYNISIDDKASLNSLFKRHEIDAVVHFAGLKSVPESIQKPDLYLRNNVQGSEVLFNAMIENKVHKIIFSSSASVYGNQNPPLTEDLKLDPLNPYAESKVKIENKLTDVSKKNNKFKVIILRYFNPVGCDSSYRIGDNQTKPTNLFPVICSSISRNSFFEVYGDDYNTHDGTPVRDFIHISDLISGHLKALDWLESSEKRLIKINLGTGKGYSVLDIVNKFQEIIGHKIKYKFSSRREGDPKVSFADNKLAFKELDWKATKNLYEMCHDSLKWHETLYKKKLLNKS